MPSKGSRAAARQAKLRNRKRRARTTSQEFQAGPIKTVNTEEKDESQTPVTGTSAVPTTKGPSQTRRSRPKQKESSELPATPRYMGPELRRIAIATLGILVLLGAGSFVLG